MSRIKNILFGKIAVSTKFITDEQLDECLQEQIELESRGERVPKLGELLEQKGYLTKRQIRSLLETMQNMQRRLFGEVATSFQFVSLDQVQTCLEIQRYLREQSENVPLFGQALVIYREYAKNIQEGGAEPPMVGEIMVKMGFLKIHQVEAVLEEQNKKIVECENCEASLNVTNFSPGQKVKCGQCQTVLLIMANETGELEAVIPREDEAEEPLPLGDEQVESFAESPEPLLAEDEEGALSASPDLGLQAQEAADSDLKLVKPITLGDFRVIAKLGQDSTGTLYKAEQMSKHRIVVLKLMNKSTMGDHEFQAKFVSEAKKVAGLDHKNLKRIFSLGKIGERYFVAQEFVEGESVHKLLEREQRIPYGRALDIAAQVAEALEYGAKRGVLHHDLRPSNLLVLPNGGVKVAQMGLATKSTENILAISKSGGLAPFYIAPEIVTEDRALDHRTDIYSLGAILFHMITGRPPYQGSSPFEILVRLTEETIPPLKFFDPSIPDPVCQIVERMLQAEPEDRYQGYEELVTDLKSVQGLAAAYSGDIPKDMEEGIVKSRRFTPLATPSPLGGAGGEGEPGEDTQKVPESRVSEARDKAGARAGDSGARGAASVKGTDPKIFVVVAAVLAIGIGGYFYLGNSGSGGGGGGSGGNTSKVDPTSPFGNLMSQVEADPANFALHIRLCNDHSANFPGDHDAEVRDILAKAREGMKKELVVKLDEMAKEVDNLIASLQFEAAFLKWNEITSESDPEMLKELLEPRRAETQQKIRAALEPEVQKAWAAAKEGNYDQAKSMIDAIMSGLSSLEDLRTYLGGELEKIDQHRKEKQAEMDARAAEEKKKQAQEIVASLGKVMQSAVRTLNFGDMMTRLGAVESDKIEGTPSKDRFLELKATCDLLIEFKNRLIPALSNHVSQLSGNPNLAKHPEVTIVMGGKPVTGRVTAADDSNLSVVIDGGGDQAKPIAWSDVPAEAVYELGRQFATAAGSATDHVSLGTYCMLRELYRQAEALLNRAVTLGEPRRNLEKFFVQIKEVLNKRAEGLMKQCTTCLSEGRPESAVMSLLSMHNEYLDTEFARSNKAGMDEAMQKAFEAMGTGKGRLSAFQSASDLSKWKQGGDGKWEVRDGLLIADGGRQAKLESEDKNVEEISFLFRVVQDDSTKMVVRLGDYKLTMEFARGRANANQGSTLRNGTADVKVGKWHFLRFYRAPDVGKDAFRISFDGAVIHEFDKPAKRDDLLIEIGSRKTNAVEIDNLLVRTN